MAAVFNIGFFVARQDFSFSSYSDICELQERNGIDLGYMYRYNDGITTLSDSEKSCIETEIGKTRFVCILADGPPILQ